MSTQTSQEAGTVVSRPTIKAQYDNYIGGKFTAPVDGGYFEVVSPVDGKVFTKVARSKAADIDLALDAAHEAFPSWSQT